MGCGQNAQCSIIQVLGKVEQHRWKPTHTRTHTLNELTHACDLTLFSCIDFFFLSMPGRKNTELHRKTTITRTTNMKFKYKWFSSEEKNNQIYALLSHANSNNNSNRECVPHGPYEFWILHNYVLYMRWRCFVSFWRLLRFAARHQYQCSAYTRLLLFLVCSPSASVFAPTTYGERGKWKKKNMRV